MKTLLLILCVLTTGCESARKAESAPATVSLDAARWDVRYSANMPAHPTQDGKGWRLTIPKDKGELDYVLCAHTAPIQSDASITMTLEVDASPTVVLDHKTAADNQIEGDAIASLILYRDMTSDFGRWWSNPGSVVLVPGTKRTLKVSLAPKNWSSVYGQFADQSDATKKEFAAVLAAPVAVGITFGGGYFKGHGLKARGGDATIKVSQFKVE